MSCGTIKAVLFDNDGTLVDTHDLLLESFRYATREVLGKVIPDELLMARVGTPLVSQMGDFADDPQVVEELVRVYRAFNEAVHDERIAAFDGVPQMLADLDAMGLALGLVTSKRRGLAVRGLEVLGLAGYLRCAVGLEDSKKHKPEPEPVLLGCELLGLEPSSCVYVGDSPFDIAAGNAAGCTTVAVTWGMFGEDELGTQNPDYVIAHPDELARVLSGICA